MKDRIEIPLSKNKIILVILGSLMFVLSGVFFIVNSSNVSESLEKDESFIIIIGIISILLFGIMGVLLSKKLFDKRPGLIIDDQGITINCNSVGFIPWKDIKSFNTLKVNNNKLIFIILKNPKEYLDKVSNPIRKSTASFNYKNYGTPFCISAISLQINFDGLERLLIEERSKHSKH